MTSEPRHVIDDVTNRRAVDTSCSLLDTNH